MRTIFLSLFLAPALVLAAGPKLGEGGFIVGVDYGPGFWALDRDRLTRQVGTAAAGVYVTDATNSHTLSLRVGYTILGHATIAAELTATGWDIFSNERGGAGFIGATAAWHPLELIWRGRTSRPFELDVSPFLGLGYGIAGERTGMDGLVIQTGLRADYWFTKWIAAGLFVRGVFLLWNNFYFDFQNRVSQPLAEGSGGSFWTIGLALTFRYGE